MLYKSASGKEVNAHSYSGGSEFKFCRRKYKLHRVLGWQEKARKAAPEFGKAIESAIQYFYENGQKSEDCVDTFKSIWAKFQNVDLVYTDKDGDWASLYSTGVELSILFELLAPSLPIRNPKFQLEYRKEVFAGSGLEFLAYIDLLSTMEDGSRLIVDIKTSGIGLNLDKNMLSLDPQLCRYAWVTGIRDVAFLWLVKSKTEYFKKGDIITLLADAGMWKATQEAVVYKFTDKTEKSEARIILGTLENIRVLDESLTEIKGKGSTEAKDKIISEYLSDGRLVSVSRKIITKVKIQFITAEIPKEELSDIGYSIGQEIVSIKDAYEKDKFLKDGGVRFPNNQCAWCPYRGICIKDNRLRDELLVQIGPAAPEKDWLDELEDGSE